MSASRRFRRKHSRSGLNKLRKAYARQQAVIDAEARRAMEDVVQPDPWGNHLLVVRDAHTAGFVLSWFASFATPEILAVTTA